jgi:hypothetical protein
MMGMMDPTSFILAGVSAVAGALLVWILVKRRALSPEETMVTQSIAERVRTVGRLVALEVCAKEIATATKGWSWLPPLLLSQARLAMIFHFEKQYAIDLRRIGPEHVTDLGDGRFRLVLPELEGTLRLTDVTPYDIQDGRVLGLLDVIQMNAKAQKGLMDQAQAQAAELFQSNDEKYHAEARRSVERQLHALMELFGVAVEIVWPEATQADVQQPRLTLPASA